MPDDTPRSPDGSKLCAWCGSPIRQSGVGRSRDYCRRTCRELAYRRRREQRLIDEAVAAATAVSTTDVPPPARVSSTDETVSSTVDSVSSVDETAPVAGSSLRKRLARDERERQRRLGAPLLPPGRRNRG